MTSANGMTGLICYKHWKCGEENVEKAKARPVMGLDRGSKFAPSQKGADFHMVLNYERVYRIFSRSKANEHGSVCDSWRR